MPRLTFSPPTRRVAVVALAGLVGLSGLTDATLTADSSALLETLIQRVVAQTTRRDVRFRARRELRAAAQNGKHQGWMDVETITSPTAGFTWTVLREGGSERTRNKVFRELLREEETQLRTGTHEAAALTPANYEFLSIVPTHGGLVQIRLKPRRDDARLIDGLLTVSSDGYPVILEGRLAKSPSFWIRAVTVVKRFGRFGGVSLPIAIETMADVKFVGPSTFTMRYAYSEVNGRRVSPEVTATATGGESQAPLIAVAARERN